MKALKYVEIIFLVCFTIKMGKSYDGNIEISQSFEDQTDEEFVDELLYFFQKGDEEIDIRPNVTDVVLILGAGGVGRTTLGYVVAGDEENTLSVVCDFNNGICQIIDEKEHIGIITPISKKMLPHLILENATNTAFYDCPGFFNNRNVTEEIANSYFLNLVANHAQRLKIFIVALYTDFNSSSRIRLLDLFSYLIDIFPNLELFSDSFVLIGNKMDSWDLTDFQIYNRMKNYLNETMRDGLEGGGLDWSNEKVHIAISLIESLIANNVNDTRLWFYLTPDFFVQEPTPITSFTRLMQGRDSIKRIISDRTSYYAPNENDFNFQLSGTAKSKILIALRSFNTQIQIVWDSIFESVQNHLQILSYEILSYNYQNIELFFDTTETFLAVLYPSFWQDERSTYFDFLKQCILLSEPFLKAQDKVRLENFTKFARYIDFLEKASGSSELIDPDEWFRKDSEVKQLTTLLVNIVNIHLNPNCTAAQQVRIDYGRNK